jgi:ABC-type molybdate transport system substrate-binding protein
VLKALKRLFGDEDRAVAFIAFVRSETGQAILAKYGFLKP